MSLTKVLLIGSIAALAGLGTVPAASTTVEAQRDRPARPFARELGQFDGTWWMNFGPPPQRPIVLTLSSTGTFVLEDSLDGGGHLPTGVRFSPTQGTWARRGGQTAAALGLRFVYDAAGKTNSVERVRLSLALIDGRRLEGTLQLEQMFCEERPSPLGFTVPVCPDPGVAETEFQRGPAPFTATRVPIDAPRR